MLPKQGFKFKQFTVHDDECQMKVGTDGVLLGAWVNVAGATRILDIGTGSGLIALMLAQRTSASTFIDAVEPSSPDVNQARTNAACSPWGDRIAIHQCTIQDFLPSAQFDLVVSNPPFFSSSLLPPSGSRARARHTLTLTRGDLIAAARRLLADNGRLALILPTAEGSQFQTEALQGELHVVRSLAFYSRLGKKQERWLFEFSRTGMPTPHETACLYDVNGDKSEEYVRLTQEFYL